MSSVTRGPLNTSKSADTVIGRHTPWRFTCFATWRITRCNLIEKTILVRIGIIFPKLEVLTISWEVKKLDYVPCVSKTRQIWQAVVSTNADTQCIGYVDGVIQKTVFIGISQETNRSIYTAFCTNNITCPISCKTRKITISEILNTPLIAVGPTSHLIVRHFSGFAETAGRVLNPSIHEIYILRISSFPRQSRCVYMWNRRF